MRAELIALIDSLWESAVPAALVDYESFYDDVRCTVKKLAPDAYAHHPDFDCYLVTIFAKLPDGTRLDYVGHPSEAPWDKINGMLWLAHNAPFEGGLTKRLKEIACIPAHVEPLDWVCTADLAAFFGYDRGLKQAAEQLFGITLDKTVRDSVMKGRYWFQFSDSEKDQILAYASDDAIAWCIFQTLYPRWPETERQLSRHTRISSARGVRVDVDRIDSDIATLTMAKWRLEQDIPWLDDEDEKGKPYKLGSPRALARECDRAGVPVPESTSVKNKDFQEWLDEYGERVPAVEALVKHRRVARQLEVYRTLKARIRPDGTVEHGLKYYGAQATGRWAGGSGLNFQNFLKAILYFDSDCRWVDEKNKDSAAYKIDIRACFIARAGKKLIIADLSQIEPRVLNWVIGNKRFLELCAAGVSPYEAAAIADGVWTVEQGSLKKKNPKLYALYKARVLALGYGAGWRKFIEMAALYVGPEEFKQIFESPVTPEQEHEFMSYLLWMSDKNREAKRDLRLFREGLDPANTDPDKLTREEMNVWVNSWLQVMSFREANPLIAARDGIWKNLDAAFRASAVDGTYELTLPSGRTLYYFNVSSSWGWSARRTRGGKPERVYGGLITENMTQAIARDVFAFGMLNLEQAGHAVLFHVHDEVIVEVDPHVTVDEVVNILTKVPEWAAGLPVAAEGIEAKHYQK